jgi:hypothetical protein
MRLCVFSQRYRISPWKVAYRFAALKSSDPVGAPSFRPGEGRSSSCVLFAVQELRGARRFLAEAVMIHSTPVC